MSMADFNAGIEKLAIYSVATDQAIACLSSSTKKAIVSELKTQFTQACQNADQLTESLKRRLCKFNALVRLIYGYLHMHDQNSQGHRDFGVQPGG